MKKVLLGGVALITLGFVGAAVAADMPVKAPPPVVVNTWTGFYTGIDVGGIYGAHESEYFSQGPGVGSVVSYDPTSLGTDSHWGLIGGIYAGYNWAVTPSWVIGVEGDWSKTSLGNTSVDPGLTSGGVLVGPAFPAGGCTTAGGGGQPVLGGGGSPTCNGVMMSDNLNWIATVRGRLGYTYGSMMLYGTAGGAFVNQEQSGAVFPNCGSVTPAPLVSCPAAGGGNTSGRTGSIAFSQSSNNTGWVAGGGLELMATANWLVRLEYLHYAFGTGAIHSVACTQCVAGAFSGPGSFTWGSSTYDTVRMGLAYKF
jgi:outer membrane immunogenic protein